MDPTQLASFAVTLNASKYFQLASFVMLIYDHMLTFDQEIERIWKRPPSGATVLFLINRYLTPLQFIIILNAFHDPQWTQEACSQFVVFEGASTVALIAVCQLLMILRLYALYARSRIVITFLITLWAAQIAVSAAGLREGFPVPLPPGFIGCIFTGTSKFFPALWVAPLIVDSVIFLMTLLRSKAYTRRSHRTPTLHVFVRDGTVYFLIIFMANLMNTLIYFIAPDAIKPIGASFSQLITAAMVSRLVLNLRSLSGATQNENLGGYLHDSFHYPSSRPPQSFFTRTMHDLGDADDSLGETTKGSLDGQAVHLETLPVRGARNVLAELSTANTPYAY